MSMKITVRLHDILTNDPVLFTEVHLAEAYPTVAVGMFGVGLHVEGGHQPPVQGAEIDRVVYNVFVALLFGRLTSL